MTRARSLHHKSLRVIQHWPSSQLGCLGHSVLSHYSLPGILLSQSLKPSHDLQIDQNYPATCTWLPPGYDMALPWSFGPAFELYLRNELILRRPVKVRRPFILLLSPVSCASRSIAAMDRTPPVPLTKWTGHE